MEKLPTKDGVCEIRLESWREFMSTEVLELFATGPAYIYRGQANYAWPLRSSLDRLRHQFPKRRNLNGGSPEFFERTPLSHGQHLDAFKRAIRGRRGVDPRPLTDTEYWALGQHHGLATPLLDWTRSPFVALFFAFEKAKCVLDEKWCEPESRGVFILSSSTIRPYGAATASDLTQLVKNYLDGEVPTKATTFNEPDAGKAYIVSPATDGNYRLINQAGLFVQMPERTDLEPYVKKEFSGRTDETLLKIRIPNVDRDDCLVALNKMNINYMTLFADIDGAAQHVNSRWAPGHEDSIAYV